jgi:type VI secretion system Hcp family effector
LLQQKNMNYPYFAILLISTIMIPLSSISAQTADTIASSGAVICQPPGITVEIEGIPGKIKVDGYTKEKKKGETTVVITKKIDKNSPTLEEMLDDGTVVATIIIEVCSLTFDIETGKQITTLYTITLEEVTIESISQEVNDDGTPGTEKITLKAKKSKSKFE